jgi:hypothetical protein
MEGFGVGDLVYTNNNGQINAAGFKINSHLMSGGESALHVVSDKAQAGGGIMGAAAVSDMFKGLAVPAGLLYLQQNFGKKYPTKSNRETLEPGLFERLLDFASDTKKSRSSKPSTKKKQSRRSNSSKSVKSRKKTRRNR